MQRSITFALLAAVLAVSIVGTSNAYAYKSEYIRNEDGTVDRYLNGHEIPNDVSIKAHALSEVFVCGYFDRCDVDLSWIPQEIRDWLRGTNAASNFGLHDVIPE